MVKQTISLPWLSGPKEVPELSYGMEDFIDQQKNSSLYVRVQEVLQRRHSEHLMALLLLVDNASFGPWL
jgi:hypothetical protein